MSRHVFPDGKRTYWHVEWTEDGIKVSLWGMADTQSLEEAEETAARPAEADAQALAVALADPRVGIAYYAKCQKCDNFCDLYRDTPQDAVEASERLGRYEDGLCGECRQREGGPHDREAR